MLGVGPVTGLSYAAGRLLVESDRAETQLVRATDAGVVPLATLRGRLAGPTALADGALLIPVTVGGSAMVWERTAAGALRPWGGVRGVRIAQLSPSPDGTRIAALVTEATGRAVIVFDRQGRRLARWRPGTRSVNALARRADGRQLIVPVMDGAGWRLLGMDPAGRAAPVDLDLPGYAVVYGAAGGLYAARAGENAATRELWRIDGTPRRLPFDVALADIVNWRPAADGLWLPDRRDPVRPALQLLTEDGRPLRRLALPRLALPGSGLAVAGEGVVVGLIDPASVDYGVVTLTRKRWWQ